MINDLWQGYDVSSTLTSNFSVDFDFLSPSLEEIRVGIWFPGIFVSNECISSTVPLYSAPRIFPLTFISCAATGYEGNRSEEGQNITVRDRYRKLCTWRDSRLFAINGFRSFRARDCTRIVNPFATILFQMAWHNVEILRIDRGSKMYVLPFGEKDFLGKVLSGSES